MTIRELNPLQMLVHSYIEKNGEMDAQDELIAIALGTFERLLRDEPLTHLQCLWLQWKVYTTEILPPPEQDPRSARYLAEAERLLSIEMQRHVEHLTPDQMIEEGKALRKWAQS
jgi:hypothetical protein